MYLLIDLFIGRLHRLAPRRLPQPPDAGGPYHAPGGRGSRHQHGLRAGAAAGARRPRHRLHQQLLGPRHPGCE